jgi:ethanolamine utilization protein EutQ (cupin superfamily)
VTTGFWEREPDTWSFERPYDEVALILEGDADIVTDDGRTLTVGPGDGIAPGGSVSGFHASRSPERTTLIVVSATTSLIGCRPPAGPSAPRRKATGS